MIKRIPFVHFVCVFLIILSFTGCSLFDSGGDLSQYQFPDALKELKLGINQIFSGKPTVWEQQPALIGGTNNLVTGVAYQAVDLYSYSLVNGTKQYKYLQFNETSTKNSSFLQEESAITFNVAHLTRSLSQLRTIEFKTTTVNSVSTTVNVISSIVTGDIALKYSTGNIQLTIASLNQTISQEAVTENNQTKITSANASISFPIQFTYKGESFSGTLKGSNASLTNALIVEGEIKKGSDKIGFLTLRWNSYGDFNKSVPGITVRDVSNTVLPEK